MNNENQVDSRIVNAVRQLKNTKDTPSTLSNPSTRDSLLAPKPQNLRMSASLHKQNTNIIPKVSTSKLLINNQPQPQPLSQPQSVLSPNQTEGIQPNKIDHSKIKSNITIPPHKKLRSISQMRQKVNTQNILIDSVLKKDNANWVNLLKTDPELKRLWEEAQLNTPLERFVQDNFYSNPTFLYKLEILTIEDQIESKKLPVFSVRRGNVSLKSMKDSLFKSEIKRKLEIRRVDNEYKSRIGSFKEKIDMHMHQLLKFDI